MFNRFYRISFNNFFIRLSTGRTGANNPKKPYHSGKGIENGDVVNLHGQISNLERFENFVGNIKKRFKR